MAEKFSTKLVFCEPLSPKTHSFSFFDLKGFIRLIKDNSPSGVILSSKNTKNSPLDSMTPKFLALANP